LDNVTHSVVGLFLAEAALVLRASRPQFGPVSDGLRASALLVSVLANNAPDIDSAYASALTQPLGSLLHHRGHTHTLVLVPVLALLALGVTLGIARARGTTVTTRDRLWLSWLALFGVAVHIGLDATNNYGVHPFWPFFDGWLYGDTVFIVEPLLWAALIPPLVVVARLRWLEVVLAVLMVVGVLLCWLLDFIPRSMAAIVTLLACGTALASYRASALRRVLVSTAATGVVLATFAVTGSVARATLLEASARIFPRAVTHDAVLTPMPADPLCWQAQLVQTDGGRYVVRSVVVAVAPSLLASDECPFDRGATPTAPSTSVPAASTPELRWGREFSAPAGELRSLARESCVFAALLQFARVPYWTKTPSLGRVAGDLRYDRSAGLDFSDTVLDGVGCPKHLPPWTPPRAELLHER
jgi:inner membrane protein